MSDYVASLIRTYVPIVVATVVTWLGNAGIILPEEASTALATVLGAVAGAVYYAVVRFLEKKYPWVGKFLGKASAPVYVAPADITPSNNAAVVSDVTQKVENLYDHRSLTH